MDEETESLLERLRAIYSDTTIEHILRPHNTEAIPNPDGYSLYQSGCGESMKIWLRIREDTIVDAGYWTNGCAATIACGSMSTELVLGKSIRDALGVTAKDIADALIDFPEGNFHCAELAAETLRSALRDCMQTQQEPWKKLYRK